MVHKPHRLVGAASSSSSTPQRLASNDEDASMVRVSEVKDLGAFGTFSFAASTKLKAALALHAEYSSWSEDVYWTLVPLNLAYRSPVYSPYFEGDI